MEIRETPFVLIARVMVKSGKVEEYMKIASTVDEAVEKTEPGMLFHHFDSDPANELKFVWTEIYKNDEALIFHINNPPVGEYVKNTWNWLKVSKLKFMANWLMIPLIF